MAKTKKVGSTTVKRPEAGKQLVIQQLNVQSVDRSKKDIGDYVTALQHAESIHHPNRVALFNVYDNIQIDGHLTGIIQKRIDAACNKTIFYKDKAGKKIDAFDDIINSETFQKVTAEIMRSKFMGISGMEFLPGKEFVFEEIPRRHIRPEKGVIVFDQYGESGIEYKGLQNIWIVGDKKDLGLLYKCAPYSIWKRGNIADWAQYIEIYGQPVMIFRYEGYDESGKLAAQKLVENVGSSLRLSLPKELNFEMVDGKANSNGDGKLQDGFRKAMNEEMSVIILGNTETTTSSSSSGYAQSKEHGKQQLEITKSDMKFLHAKLNNAQFISILKSYGFPVVEGGSFAFEKEIDLSELKVRSEIDSTIKSTGLPIDDDHFYQTYGIAKPADYDAQKEAQRKAKENPPADPNADPADPNKKPAPKPGTKTNPNSAASKKLLDDKGFMFKLRALVADFFDPAP